MNVFWVREPAAYVAPEVLLRRPRGKRKEERRKCVSWSSSALSRDFHWDQLCLLAGSGSIEFNIARRTSNGKAGPEKGRD